MANRPPTVTVTLDVQIEVDVADTGYLGIDSTVAKHLQKAKDDVQRSWQFLVKQGALEPKQVAAKVKVRSIVIIPNEG